MPRFFQFAIRNSQFAIASTCALLLTAQDVTLRVDVRLVTVLATVRNSSGDLVTNLSKDDFEIRDENAAADVKVFARESDLPLSIALLLDASLSTAKDLKFEQEAAIRFLRSTLRAQDRASLFTFTHDVFQIAPFTSNVATLERAIRSVKPQGGTSLFDAILLASEELRRQKGRRVLILITDGGDTTSSTDFHRALRSAHAVDAVIYSVVVVPIPGETGRNVGGEHALELLSERTGGRTMRADSPAHLDPAFAAIGEELRTQYVLGFYAPSNAALNVIRRLEVRAKNPSLTVRARKGYYLVVR